MMEHKAFIFDLQAFRQELYPIVTNSVCKDDPKLLRGYINEHLGKVLSPYTGEPLDSNWENELENGDMQELTDFGITCFYSPEDDRGLSFAWDAVLEGLKKVSKKINPEYCVLGEPLEVKTFLFDPGGMGTGFVEAEDVPLIYDHLLKLRDKVIENGLPTPEDKLYDIDITELEEAYDDFIQLYKDAANAKCGLLMTF